MQTSNWRERFKEIMLIGIGEHHSQDCCAYWQGEKMVELEAFIEQVQKESIERAIGVVEKLPYKNCTPEAVAHKKDLVEAIKTLLH